MSDHSDQLIRQTYRRYFNLCIRRAIKPMSFNKFRSNIDLRIKRYIATELAKAVQEQQPEREIYIATPALDVKEEIIEKFGFKYKLCSLCEKEVAVDPKMLEYADSAKEIVCVNCLPGAVDVTMEEITKLVLGQEGN